MRCSRGTRESRRKTPGSMTSGFFNQLPQLLRSLADKFSLTFHFPIPLLRGSFKCRHFVRRCAVLDERIIRRFNLDFAKGNNIRSGNNADIFAAGGGSEPLAKVLFGVGYC